MADPTTDWNGDEDDSSFDTSTPEANRSIEQGNGIGARELAAQREPTEEPLHDPLKTRADDGEEDEDGDDEA